MAALGVTVDVSVLGVLAAFGGGVISFLSPCVLPIVPGYLSVVSGLSIGELEDPDPRHVRRIFTSTLVFVAGFTTVFVLLGLSATFVGQWLVQNQDALTRISGGLMILLALYLAGSQVLMTPGVYRELRLHPHLERFGPFAAYVAGAAFAFGWTPCIGPILASVLSVASTKDTAGGGLLLFAYSAGLGLSFLVVGLLFGRLAGPLSWVKRHSRGLTFVSAAILFLFGLILLTNNLSSLTARLQDFLDAIGLHRLTKFG
ncbi:MAG: cytochrome c biogenesis protein CcdA [Acidimicrobiia bacterium]